ncbi:MAG: Gfo/Idh/MocA family oxidoreductase, partial [Rhodothermales bacterium]|nr:Gfo/Idh/MocA family oxidoreductase [Rhodothermales bacterium]
MHDLPIGLIGCGRVAQRIHLRALRALRGVRVVALAEPDPERRRQASRLVPEAAPFADHESLLATSGAEAVVVSAPPPLHAAIAQAALEAGRHVYLEKPGATSLTEADAVVAAWRRSGLVATVGLNFRSHPLYAALRDGI